MMQMAWEDVTPYTAEEFTVVERLLECGYYRNEVAVRKQLYTGKVIGAVIIKPRPTWLLAWRLLLAGKGL